MFNCYPVCSKKMFTTNDVIILRQIILSLILIDFAVPSNESIERRINLLLQLLQNGK